MRFRLHQIVPLLLLALTLPAAALAGGRIVAVGDIHGELDGFVAILREAGLIDADRRWIGGEATLVQTGDFLDRGPGARRVMDLLMDLERQAPEHGGRVVVLLGNHEAINLFHDFQFLTAEIYASFADGASGKRRKQAYRDWREWMRQWQPDSLPTREAWMQAHPPGFLAYREGLAPDGVYGRWLRTLPVMARIGGVLFLHGGLHPEMAESSVEEINATARRQVAEHDRARARLLDERVLLPLLNRQQSLWAVSQKLAQIGDGEEPRPDAAELQGFFDHLEGKGDWLAFDYDSPVWFRGFADWPEEEGAAHVAELLAAHGARHFVVGHTPQPKGIRMRFGGGVFLIDTGMLKSAYHGRAAALEIAGGRFTAIYENGKRELLLEPTASAARAAHRRFLPAALPSQEEGDPAAPRWLGPDGAPLPFAGAAEATAFLEGAEVVDIDDIPTGITEPKKILLERGGVRAHAIFRYRDTQVRGRRMNDGSFVMSMRDSYISEVAAFELAQLLGMDNVPPAVKRKVRSQPGSVQLWIEGTRTEEERQEGGLKPPDRVRFSHHIWDMRIFDNLIHNVDRNLGNILLDGDWNVWLVDHTRAFGHDKLLHAPELVERCSRPLWQRLRALTPQQLRQRLSPYLRKFQIRALTARLEKLIELLEARIAERGEGKVIFEPRGASQVFANVSVFTTTGQKDDRFSVFY